MRKTIAAMVAVAMLAIALPVIATQNEAIVEGYYTVAWEIPGPDHFPQNYISHVFTGEVKNLDALDHKLDECEKYQVDVYKIDSGRDIGRLTSLIAKGTLDLLPNGLPEDNKIYHSSKIVEAEECETEETTTTTEATTTTTEPTTSTTQPTTTTTTAPSSTTSTVTESTSTTSVEKVTTTTQPTPPTELPFTGNELFGLDADLVKKIGGVFGLIGLLSLGLARRLRGEIS